MKNILRKSYPWKVGCKVVLAVSPSFYNLYSVGGILIIDFSVYWVKKKKTDWRSLYVDVIQWLWLWLAFIRALTQR